MTVTDNQPVSVGNLKAVLSSLGGGSLLGVGPSRSISLSRPLSSYRAVAAYVADLRSTASSDESYDSFAPVMWTNQMTDGVRFFFSDLEQIEFSGSTVRVTSEWGTTRILAVIGYV